MRGVFYFDKGKWLDAPEWQRHDKCRTKMKFSWAIAMTRMVNTQIDN